MVSATAKPTLSRLEVNFLRVFRETQQMASGAKTRGWSFDKQVQWLERTLPELEKSPCPPSTETLQSHKRQLQKLRAVLEADSKIETDSQAVVLAPVSCPATTEEASLTQQIQHRTAARLDARLRKELLGDDDGGGRGESVSGAEARLASDEQRRERLLSDMLLLTRQWKEQSTTAGSVIKRDLQTLDQSSRLATGNEAALKTESERLAALNQRACNCWIWIMLVLVCFAFISMVLFIRIFPKRRVILAA